MNKIKINPMHIKGMNHGFGLTDFGMTANFKEIYNEKLTSDPNNSKMSISYDNLIETPIDEYESNHINQNCLKLEVVNLIQVARLFSNLTQSAYDNYEQNFHYDENFYLEVFMNAYSVVNIINDLQKKKDKKILLLGANQLFLTYLSSILFYATKDFDNFKLDLFTIKSLENGKVVHLQRQSFKNNLLEESDRNPRKIQSVASLQKYLIVSVYQNHSYIVVPEIYDQLQQYRSSRGYDVDLNDKIHKYTSLDLKNVQDFADFLSKFNFHNDHFNESLFSHINENYILNIPTYKSQNKLIKKSNQKLIEDFKKLAIQEQLEEEDKFTPAKTKYKISSKLYDSTSTNKKETKLSKRKTRNSNKDDDYLPNNLQKVLEKVKINDFANLVQDQLQVEQQT